MAVDEQDLVDQEIRSRRGRWRIQLELANLSEERWAKVGSRVVTHLLSIKDVPIFADDRIGELLEENDGQALTAEELRKCWAYIRMAVMLGEIDDAGIKSRVFP